MQRPVPAGAPMRLPPQVAGSLSRLQGMLQRSQPQIQNAYAAHWLALRQAGGVPEFQTFTQHMAWGAYGTMALGGLLRHALAGRGQPEVVAGIVDQLHLLQHHYGEAAQSLQAFLQRPDAADYPAVRPMVDALRPLDQVYQAAQPPKHTVLNGLPWHPGPMLDLPQIQGATWEVPEVLPEPPPAAPPESRPAEPPIPEA
ncbi:MAG: hypothetical protein JWN15_2531 [Firmicutes bacterium]|nr:hypothetical protein [Bacillota bacterium]